MPSLPRLSSLLATLLVATFGLSVAASSASAEGAGGLDKRVCVRALHVDEVEAFSALIGRDVNCVLTYNDVAPDWAAWENPWLISHTDPNQNWATWKNAVPGRKLIISESLFPKSENAGDWRNAGARGDYDEHARQLARNLIAAGQGDAVIRLAHEANGDWYVDNIGDDAHDYARWVAQWRRTVLAMKSVPGAHFTFDWCPNANYRSIPLANYYPGDDVVDIIGMDTYDSGIPNTTDGASRWSTIYNRRASLGEAVAFAKAHNKPLSIPEWGVAQTSKAYSGGDNAEYVNGIAKVVRTNDVAYQSYFYAYDWRSQLEDGPRSLAAYRKHFGANGDSLSAATTPADSAPATPTTTTPPAPTTTTAPTTPKAAPTATIVTLPVTLPVTAPVAISLTTPAVDLRASSLSTARALTAAATTQLKAAAKSPKKRTTSIAVTPTTEGTACVVAVPVRTRSVVLRCGTSRITVSAGAKATIAKKSARGTVVKMSQVRAARAVRGVLRFALPSAEKAKRVTIVSAFVPSGNPSAIGIATRGVRLAR
jgi:beta-mannanase